MLIRDITVKPKPMKRAGKHAKSVSSKSDPWNAGFPASFNNLGKRIQEADETDDQTVRKRERASEANIADETPHKRLRFSESVDREQERRDADRGQRSSQAANRDRMDLAESIAQFRTADGARPTSNEVIRGDVGTKEDTQVPGNGQGGDETVRSAAQAKIEVGQALEEYNEREETAEAGEDQGDGEGEEQLNDEDEEMTEFESEEELDDDEMYEEAV